MARVTRILTYEADSAEVLRSQLEHSAPDGDVQLPRRVRLTASTVLDDDYTEAFGDTPSTWVGSDCLFTRRLPGHGRAQDPK